MKILLAEDDLASARGLRLSLERNGHEVLVASSGDAAWTAFQANPARVVLSDWMMPGLDGLQLCQRIRRGAGEEYTYFILLTAVNLGRQSLRDAMRAGVDDFLPKPVDLELLSMRLAVAERIVDTNRQIQILEKLLPICMYCKRIRDDRNYWQQLESYIHERTGSCFSHGVCPECFTREHGVGGHPTASERGRS
jgi:sigma-B regulation protein RsbU (phosphoserine phosphatase)